MTRKLALIHDKANGIRQRLWHRLTFSVRIIDSAGDFACPAPAVFGNSVSGSVHWMASREDSGVSGLPQLPMTYHNRSLQLENLTAPWRQVAIDTQFFCFFFFFFFGLC